MAAPTGNGNTKPRSVRVADDSWEAAKAVAAAKGETVTDVVVRALEAYVRNGEYLLPEFAPRTELAQKVAKSNGVVRYYCGAGGGRCVLAAGHKESTKHRDMHGNRWAEHECACGRTFTTRSGRANHGNKCPKELARRAAYIAEIEGTSK